MDRLERNPMRDRTLDDTYHPAPRAHPSHSEGGFTRVLEQQTARIPSGFFLLATLGSMAASAAFELLDHPRASRFVGMWAPTLLVAGVYNKLVKLLGSS